MADPFWIELLHQFIQQHPVFWGMAALDIRAMSRRILVNCKAIYRVLKQKRSFEPRGQVSKNEIVERCFRRSDKRE